MVNIPETEVPLLLRLREAVTRVRRAMPMDRDVQEICYALRVVLDLQPKKNKKKVERFERAWKASLREEEQRRQKEEEDQKKEYRREYSRLWMAERRAAVAAANPNRRPPGRPRRSEEQPTP